MPNAPVSDTTVVLNCHNIINATERIHIPSRPSMLWQELFGSQMDHQPMFCIFIICKKGQDMQLTQLRKLTTLKRNVEWWMENTRSAAWRAEKMWVVLGGAYLLPTTYPALKPSCCCLVWPILSSVARLTIEPPTCIAEWYVFILLLYRNYARKGAFSKSSAPQHLIIFGPLWLHIYERYVFD